MRSWGAVAASLGVLVAASLLGSQSCARAVDRSRIYRIGTDNAYPYHGLDAAGKPVGFAAEVIAAAASAKGIRLQWVATRKTPLESLTSGEVDLWPATGRSSGALAAGVHFTRPWLRNEYVLVSQAPVPAELEAIGYVPFPVAAELAQRAGPRARRIAIANRESLWEAVCRGELNVGLLERRVALYFLEHPPGECRTFLRMTGLSFPQPYLHVASRREMAPVADELRHAIDELVASGQLRDMLRRWAYYDIDETHQIYGEAVARRQMLLALLASAFLAGGVALVALMWRRSRRTAEQLAVLEQSLRASEERFRALIERSGDVIAIIGLDRKVVFVSPAVRGMLGYMPEEVQGRDALVFVRADCAKEVERQLERVAQHAGAVAHFETLTVHKEGQAVDVDVTVSNLNHIPAVSGIVVNARQITERKAAEAERERLIKELQQKNAELERLIYTVSHDFKSPLITICGYLGFVGKALEENDVAAARKDLTRIEKASRHLKNAIEQLLQVSRAGWAKGELRNLPFWQLVEEAVDLVSGALEANHVRLNIEPDLPWVRVDPTRMVEALQNLLENAIKFTRHRPDPHIRIGCRGGDPPVFFVQDNGIGIEEKFFEKIFGLFDKLDPKSEGAGIGLAIVKRIVESHQGRIWVESEGPGRGATFCFTLPATESGSASAEGGSL